MKPLELNVLFCEEQDLKLQELGITPNPDNLAVDKMVFYVINAISPHISESGKDWCEIFCNGVEFICPESYETVKRKIQNNL